MPSTTTSPQILGFPEYREPARRLAEAAGLDYAEVAIHHFPDGESKVRLPLPLAERLILCRTLDHPNAKLVELELAAAAARQLGAKHLTLVAPYLAYMRQDIAFNPGEAVSQCIIGDMLARRFDALITVDPHLHRIQHLEQAVPVRPAIALSAATLMADYLARHGDSPLLIGPDEESTQWVAAIAGHRGLDYVVAHKQRLGDTRVKLTLPPADYSGRHLVLVDDVVSTGHTLEAAARQLAPQRPASISVLVSHALFVDDAQTRLAAAGISRICSTDSVLHPTNRLLLAPLLAQALHTQAARPLHEPT